MLGSTNKGEGDNQKKTITSPTTHIPDSTPEDSSRESMEVTDQSKKRSEDAVSTEDVVSTDKEKVSTDRSKVSTDKQKVSTDKEKDSTDRQDEETPKKEDTAKVPAKVDVTEQGTKKRKGGHIKMLARKRKRPQSDVDSDDEHKKCLKIVTFEGTIDSEIMERKYVSARLDKGLRIQKMLDLGLEVERESTAALDLIRLIKQQIDEE
ncbi:hypothetical protein Tco_1201670 [Tanacetum coccineum]